MNGSDADVDRLHEDNNILVYLFNFLMVTKYFVIFDAAESV